MKFVDAALLRQMRTDRHHTCRSLAQLTRALEEMDPGRYRRVSHGLVGSLELGQTKTVHDLRANAIERVLSVRPGTLFAAQAVNRPVDMEQVPA